MMENPYLNESPINLPLEFELCQEIHWIALQATTRGLHLEAAPEYLDLAQLAKAKEYLGTDVFLFHQDYLETVFTGVTLAHYQTIKTLYCSRLRRSIRMIHLILAKMAEEAEKPPILYEAVWAICLQLEDKLQRNTAVKIERTNSSWQLIILEPQVVVEQESEGEGQPKIICIVELDQAKVLAYRIVTNDLDNAINLVIYDALISARQPALLIPTGLVWPVPTHFYAEINLDGEAERVIQQNLQVQIEHHVKQSPFIDTLRAGWEENLAGRIVSRNHFDRVFDNYLHRIHKYGPKRVQADLEEEYASLIGYNQDPASLFPSLRWLLPQYKATVSTTEPAIFFDGLHYTDPLLKYWSGEEIALRRSEQTESTAWIYFEGEILCEAKARELRRSDGSYRQSRHRRP